MERELQTIPKLIDVVRRDYPTASDILVSFPDQWEYLDVIRTEHTSLYLAAFPLARERPTRHHFEGLPIDVNLSLVFYRLYKFFRPWPISTVTVEWKPHAPQGRVTGVGEAKLHLQPIGQAQAWFGVDHAVLWECYFHENERRANWQATLADVWQRVEHDLRAQKIFTLPHEPTFTKGYPDFLQRLGYAMDPDNPEWWSKAMPAQHDSRLSVSE